METKQVVQKVQVKINCKNGFVVKIFWSEKEKDPNNQLIIKSLAQVVS